MFEKIYSFQNLHSAYLKARKCKRYRPEILEFSYNLEKNLLELKNELKTQRYRHGGYREFIVCDAKKRKIKAAPFRDRVVHHALVNIIEPIFDKGFIYDSYACRSKKGTHRAVKRLEQFMKAGNDKSRREREKNYLPKMYCFKGDISKYFENVDHNILMKIIRRKISDQRVLGLIEKIIDSSYEHKIYKNLFEFRATGIPIGNLTSQLFANIYLNELDKFVKHQIRAKYYIRYMDDFLILGYDKKELHKLKERVKKFLQSELKLNLHPKKANIFPAGKGIDFLGYQIFVSDLASRRSGRESYRFLRKSTVKRFTARVKICQKELEKGLIKKKKFDQSVQSWLAYASFGNSWRLRRDLTERLKIKLIKFS